MSKSVIFNLKYKFPEERHVQKLFVGIEKDFNLLYAKFKEGENLTFNKFAKAWRDLRFASIFCYRIAYSEILEYTQGLLHFSKGYIFSSDQDATIFGLYLAYSIYFKQPLLELPVKLRITMEEFIALKLKLNELLADGEDEPVFVYETMHDKGAISYVATPIEAGLEFGFRKYFDSAEDDETVGNKRNKPPFNKDLLTSLSETIKVYNKVKGTAFPDETITKDALSFVEKMKKKLDDFGQKIEVDLEPKIEPGTSSSLGEERRRLKDKSFRRRSQRKQAETHDEENDEAVKMELRSIIRNKPRPKAFLSSDESASGGEDENQVIIEENETPIKVQQCSATTNLLSLTALLDS